MSEIYIVVVRRYNIIPSYNCGSQLNDYNILFYLVYILLTMSLVSPSFGSLIPSFPLEFGFEMHHWTNAVIYLNQYLWD